MKKPIYTITKDVSVGIYNNCEYIAKICIDKIVVISPYVKWVGNSGSYDDHCSVITNIFVRDYVLKSITAGHEAAAWAKIGEYLDDPYLVASGF